MTEETQSERRGMDRTGAIAAIVLVVVAGVVAIAAAVRDIPCADDIWKSAKHGDPEFRARDKIFGSTRGEVRLVNGFGVWSTYEYICTGEFAILDKKAGR